MKKSVSVSVSKQSYSPPMVVIVGPTASGKSALALEVAQRYNGEIICADSRTVYMGMDIGTAKPSAEDRRLVPHHILDVVDPGERFTAADFKTLANRSIANITKRGKLPVMVGGTGLYIDSVIFDYNFDSKVDISKRSKIESLTVLELQKVCRDKNINIPENSKNKRHLIRAIELGGLKKQNKRLRENTLVVGITMDNSELKGRIEDRAHAMIREGIVQEVRSLARQYGWDNEAMTGNIYRVFRRVVEGTASQQEALDEFIRSDAALVKRQLTWFKRNPYIIWGPSADLRSAIDDFLRRSISS